MEENREWLLTCEICGNKELIGTQNCGKCGTAFPKVDSGWENKPEE